MSCPIEDKDFLVADISRQDSNDTVVEALRLER
jgi:hypothetical protein